MTPEKRDRLRKDTREAAAAFLEDMEQIRSVLRDKVRVRRSIRHLSVILRRWLVDGDLKSISSCRTDRFFVEGPDNKEFYHFNDKRPLRMFLSGGPSEFDYDCRALTLEGLPVKPYGFDPERKVELSLDEFAKQKVIAWHGQWVTRRDVVKFFANKASGVHSDIRRSSVDEIIDRVRSIFSYVPTGSGFMMKVNVDAIAGKTFQVDLDPDAIDNVHLELLACAFFISKSRDVMRLEEIVRTEIII